MNSDELLAHLTREGVELWLEGDRLRYRAPQGVLTADLRAKLATCKPEVVSRLRERERGTTNALPSLVPAPEQRYQPFPLTEIQQAYWLGRTAAFELGNVACHSYSEIDFDGLDLDRFGRAWQRLIERHDMLRVIVLPDGRQQILKQPPPYQVQVLDLRDHAPSAREPQLEALRERMSHQVLPTDQWPLFEVRATRLDDRITRLHLSFDLLVGDIWSSRIALSELLLLYQDPEASLPPLELSFRDYVLAQIALQSSDAYKRALDYWRERLPALPAVVELPLARAPGTVVHPRFVRRSDAVEPETWRQLKARAARAHLTPSEVVLAAFAQVLATWSRNPRFSLNLTYFNRLPLHPQVNSIVGDFTATILLEVDAAADSFAVSAQRLHEQLWRDLEHSQVSGVQVLREMTRARGQGMSGMPVVFTSGLAVGGAGPESTPFTALGKTVYGVSQTPQVWLDHQLFEEGGALLLNWDAVEELFPPGLLDDMFAAYGRLLRRLATEESAWREAVALIPASQLEQRATVNATGAPVPQGLLHEPLVAQVAARPHHPAVVTPLRTLSYDELYRRSNQVGHRLRQLGARPNQLVGVVMEKGWEQVVAALGVLASGAAYLPIDPALPTERLRYLLEHGEVELALTQPWLEGRVAWPDSVQRLVVGDGPWDGVDETPLRAGQTPDDLAYVIFTSGSTGLPKGVMIDHRAALNTCVDINRRFNVSPDDRVLALSSLAFDLSVYDIFGVLGAGGTVVMPSAEARHDPAHWAQLIELDQVTLWNTVPELMEMLVEHLEGGRKRLPPSLRLVAMSGDWIPLTLPDRIRQLAQHEPEIVSLGGATEASIWSILYPVGEVDPAWKSIPYGKPMVNQTFHVLSPGLEPCPVWVPGNLYIGGVGLARGYWRDADKTRERFINHPRTGERLYWTGDLGRYLPDGNIEFLGREDLQVKLRGHRIELGEIEAALEHHPGVRAGVVQAVGDPRGDRQLVAYIVPNHDHATDLFETESVDADEAQHLWHHLVETGRLHARRAPEDLDSLATTMRLLERMGVAYLSRALRELGAFDHAGATHSVDDLLTRFRILPRYRKLTGQWLRALEEEGLLKSSGEQTHVSPLPLPTNLLDAVASDWNAIKQQASLVAPEAQAFLSYLQQSGKHLTALLRGEADPLTLLFPGGSWETAESLYQQNPVSRYFNTIAAQVLAALARSWPVGRQLRVLELGAGTGGTTTYLLHELPPESTVYTYTDLSTFFTDQAQHKFQGYPFIQYGLLNIDDSPQPQGYGPHSVDVIVAANVLHDARNLPQTLSHVLSLLAPNGLLLLLEGTRYSRWQMMTVGFIEGLSAFEDERQKDNEPFLPAGRWEQLLLARGFTRFATFPEPGPDADCLGEHVMIAQSPAAVRRFKAGELRKFLKAKLPEYMLPSSYVVLSALPLSPNGKVDRRALPVPGNKALREPRSDYVPPQTDLERTLAGIWQDLLHVEKVGVRDSFFELGGDSLLTVRLQRKLQETFGREFPVAELLKNPTVSGCAEFLSRAPVEQSFQESDERAAARRAALRRRRSR